MVAGIDLQIGDTDIRIISTYWSGSTGSTMVSSHSLWDKLQTYLHKRGQHITPLEYIQSYTAKKIEEHISATKSVCLVGGDFNATRDSAAPGHGVHGPIDIWATQAGLTHVFAHLTISPRPTYYSGTQPKHEIDHILSTTSTYCYPTHGYILDDDAWAQETDH